MLKRILISTAICITAIGFASATTIQQTGHKVTVNSPNPITWSQDHPGIALNHITGTVHLLKSVYVLTPTQETGGITGTFKPTYPSAQGPLDCTIYGYVKDSVLKMHPPTRRDCLGIQVKI